MYSQPFARSVSEEREYKKPKFVLLVFTTDLIRETDFLGRTLRVRVPYNYIYSFFLSCRSTKSPSLFSMSINRGRICLTTRVQPPQNQFKPVDAPHLEMNWCSSGLKGPHAWWKLNWQASHFKNNVFWTITFWHWPHRSSFPCLITLESVLGWPLSVWFGGLLFVWDAAFFLSPFLPFSQCVFNHSSAYWFILLGSRVNF